MALAAGALGAFAAAGLLALVVVTLLPDEDARGEPVPGAVLVTDGILLLAAGLLGAACLALFRAAGGRAIRWPWTVAAYVAGLLVAAPLGYVALLVIYAGD